MLQNRTPILSMSRFYAEENIKASITANSSGYRVVAVHGVAGNSTDTWASMESARESWLTGSIFNQLPRQHNKVRILKYGYDEDIETAWTGQGIRGHAAQLARGLLEAKKGRDGSVKHPF
jgi:hypothetical protein